jgi:hypothetical protein
MRSDNGNFNIERFEQVDLRSQINIKSRLTVWDKGDIIGMLVFRFNLLQLGLSLTADVLRLIKCTPFYLHLIRFPELAINTGIGAGLRRILLTPMLCPKRLEGTVL